MSSYHGSCDCGQVEWDATVEKQEHVLCHCTTCRKLSGGAYTLNQIVPKESLKIIKEKDKIKTYTYTGVSGKPVHCYYCGNCTTHVYHHQTALGDNTIILRSGLLDDGIKFQPALEIFGKDRLSWQKEVAKTFDAAPA